MTETAADLLGKADCQTQHEHPAFGPAASTMSLYFDAAGFIDNTDKTGGSLKNRIYASKTLKCPPSQVFALVSQAAKWSAVLKEVIEKAELLKYEKKLTPTLALLLVHDLLLSKNGIAAREGHSLKLAVLRHKAHLKSEFIKARVKGGYASVEAWKDAINSGNHGDQKDSRFVHPRWIRVNAVKTTLEHQLATTFAEYTRAPKLDQLTSKHAAGHGKTLYVDENIPNLIAISESFSFTDSRAYKKGELILQDKASCFPVHLLDPRPQDGKVIDACAAPGNKTTQLAAAVNHKPGTVPHVIAFERDQQRATTLRKMVGLAGAENIVSLRAGKDFLASDPLSKEFSHVGALLLDPSCSGSGIIGRETRLKVFLPDTKPNVLPSRKKRKRGNRNKTEHDDAHTTSSLVDVTENEESDTVTTDESKLKERLEALSAFQLRIVTHAMRFPRARKITYSTCSVHLIENEGVVLKALLSDVAQERGWRILKRDEQVAGLKSWPRRGDQTLAALDEAATTEHSVADIIDACIRCEPDTKEGTMGFFVAGFVRDSVDDVVVEHDGAVDLNVKDGKNTVPVPQELSVPAIAEDDEWAGFSSDDDNDAAASGKMDTGDAEAKNEANQSQSRKNGTKGGKRNKRTNVMPGQRLGEHDSIKPRNNGAVDAGDKMDVD